MTPRKLADGSNGGWCPGQQAVINRQTVVTIERVTPSGRAVANGIVFESDGTERSGVNLYRRSKLEPLTVQIQAEMDLVQRGIKARAEARIAIDNADRWLRNAFRSWGRSEVPEATDVEKAERLTTAIQKALDTP